MSTEDLNFRNPEAYNWRVACLNMASIAMHDSLTGLPNRNGQHVVFEEYAQKQNELGEDFAVLLVDIKSFGKANERIGYDQGDEVLIEASKCLTQTVRSNDVVARESGHALSSTTRLGGDEFLLFFSLKSAANTQDTTELIEERRSVKHDPLMLSEPEKIRKLQSISSHVNNAGQTCAAFVDYNKRDDVPEEEYLGFHIGEAIYIPGDTLEDIKRRANINKVKQAHQGLPAYKRIMLSGLKKAVKYIENQ